MKTAVRILLAALLSVLLVSCAKTPASTTSEDTELSQHDQSAPDYFYETPEIAIIRIDDNTKRLREGNFSGPGMVYYLFDKNGDVYRLDNDPCMSLDKLAEKYDDGSLSDRIVKYVTIDDKDGLQKCFDKLQIVIHNKDFELNVPDYGPDWSHKDITWYALYYDDGHNLQTKKIFFTKDLEGDYKTNDKNADDIVSWLENYVSAYAD